MPSHKSTIGLTRSCMGLGSIHLNCLKGSQGPCSQGVSASGRTTLGLDLICLLAANDAGAKARDLLQQESNIFSSLF